MLPDILIVLQHFAHILFAESQHHVELEVGTDVPSDVESAGQVVQDDGADAGHEDALEHTFILLEYFSIEAADMGQGMIHLIALFIKDYVGKIIIFINDKVKGSTGIVCLPIQEVQFIGRTELLFHIFFEPRIIVRFINKSKIIQGSAAIIIKIPV